MRKWIPFQIATERTELLAVLVKFDCVETRVGACAYSTDMLVYNLPYKFGMQTMYVCVCGNCQQVATATFLVINW